MPQTTTERGRAKLVTPDVGYDAEIDGGVALGVVVNAIWAQIGDSLGTRWSGSVTVANGNYVDVTHNFNQPFGALKVIINQSDGSVYTKFQISTNFTLSYPDANTLRVTNISGGSLTFFVTVLPYNLGLGVADFDEGFFGSESDDIRLNKDAAGSGGNWIATIRRPSSGQTADAVHTLPPATSTLATLGLDEAVTGTKTYSGLPRFTKQTDSSATGADASLATPTRGIVEVTNASLTSLAMIPAPTAGASQTLLLVNRTGVSIQLKDETGGTAANRIKTGTSAPLDVAASGVVPLVYDHDIARWVVYGGAGSGGGTEIIATETSHGFTAGKLVYRGDTGWFTSTSASVNGARVTGVVKSVTDANTFVVTTSGTFARTGTAGDVLYLSTSGNISTSPGTARKVIGMQISSTLAFLQVEPTIGTGGFASISGVESLSNKTNLAAAGTAGAPTHSFVDETTMGFYRSASGTTAWSVGSAQRLTMATSLFAWSGGRLDVIAQSTNLAEVRVTTAAAATSRFIIAAQGNQGVTGSSIGDTVFLGNSGNAFLWSTDGSSILSSIDGTSIYHRIKMRWANLGSNPSSRNTGDSWYRTDTNRFMGAVGANTADIGHIPLQNVRGVQGFAAGGDFAATFSDIPHEIFPVKAITSAGNITMAALAFTSTAPQEGKVVELIGTSDSDTITLQDSRGSAKGLVMNGDWTSFYGRSITFRYLSTLDRWVETSRN